MHAASFFSTNQMLNETALLVYSHPMLVIGNETILVLMKKSLICNSFLFVLKVCPWFEMKLSLLLKNISIFVISVFCEMLVLFPVCNYDCIYVHKDL